MEQKQERTPWRQCADDDLDILDADGEYVAKVIERDDNFDSGESSRAALIVKAVNSHATHLTTIEAQAKTIEAMRVALMNARSWVRFYKDESAQACLTQIDSALALAQTEKK